jgi:predicted nucleic acid-binding protein
VTVFADSSAIVKFYADEPGYPLVRALPFILVCQLVRVEVPAAFWRKQRMGELTAAQAAVLVAAFEADYCGTAEEEPRFTVVAITAQLLDDAAHLAGVHGLRAYDAVQLATAKAAATTVVECRAFAAFDTELRTAAAAEGFGLVPS